jgi:hypothetical protein
MPTPPRTGASVFIAGKECNQVWQGTSINDDQPAGCVRRTRDDGDDGTERQVPQEQSLIVEEPVQHFVRAGNGWLQTSESLLQLLGRIGHVQPVRTGNFVSSSSARPFFDLRSGPTSLDAIGDHASEEFS